MSFAQLVASLIIVVDRQRHRMPGVDERCWVGGADERVMQLDRRAQIEIGCCPSKSDWWRGRERIMSWAKRAMLRGAPGNDCATICLQR